MADFNNDVAVVENNDVEVVTGEVVNTNEVSDEERMGIKDVALIATATGIFAVGVVETTKKVIKFGKWAGSKIKAGFGKAKQKFGKKEAEVTEDVTEVTTEEEVKTE